MASLAYPFEPRSNAHLVPGQFWGVRLSDGRWACGRVLALPLPGQPGSRAVFLCGLMDWVGDEPPSGDSIAGSALLAQANTHYKTIMLSGTPILGHRRLELDRIRHSLWRSAWFGDSDVLDYLTVVRRSTEEDKRTLPGQQTWQGDHIRNFAERHLVRREPFDPLRA